MINYLIWGIGSMCTRMQTWVLQSFFGLGLLSKVRLERVWYTDNLSLAHYLNGVGPSLF